MNHLSQTFCLLVVRDLIFLFIFWYYLPCSAIIFIIIPAVIYVFQHPDVSSLLIQLNCTLFFMLILTPPPPPPSITKRNFIWIFPKEELFPLPLPQHTENVDILYCFCWKLLPYIWISHHFFFNHLFKKKSEIMKFGIDSIDSHYLTRQHVLFWITIVLLFFNIK